MYLTAAWNIMNNAENFFCKNYTNKKQIYNIISQAYQTNALFKGYLQKSTIALTLTNISHDHLFFFCDMQENLEISANTELVLTFHIPLANSTLPCEFTVPVVTYTQNGNKFFFVTMFPYTISLLQRREQIRYPVKREAYPFYELAFTDTQVVKEEWETIDNGNIVYHDISTGGLYIQLKNIDTINVPTLKSVLILKCKFPPLQPQPDKNKKECSSFIITARICNIRKVNNELYIRAKYTHWTYNLSIKKWNAVYSHDGIVQLQHYIAS